MGSENSAFSQEDYNTYSLQLYEATLQQQCLLPDVGIDESLLKYSAINSNAVLQSYSNELINTVPGYISRLGSSLGPMTAIPNAVGLGALIISMMMELIIRSATQTENSYSMFRRVFGEEKASSVRDTMSEYVRRHRMFMHNSQQLQEELQRLEQQLSNHLTILRNSLLHDEQMSSRGFKIWVNGASFHVHMLIHKARLNIQTGKLASDYVRVIRTAISLYLLDLDHLLEKYRSQMMGATYIIFHARSCLPYVPCSDPVCTLGNYHRNCHKIFHPNNKQPCTQPELKMAYMNHIFSKYEPISGLKSHFVQINNNLDSLINQRDSFTLPSTD